MSRAPYDDFYKWTKRPDVDPKPAYPHGWIQWKGTDACMDIRCECGALHHFDGYFGYTLRLPCGRVVHVAQHVKLTPIPAELLPLLENVVCCQTVLDPDDGD